jgi:flagellar biosynthetic protein FliP
MNDGGQFIQHLSDSKLFDNLSPALQTALFLSTLTLLPAALVTLTAYTRIIIVLGFVRRAVTAQEIPPNSVLVGLALFLTLFIMGPTWDQIASKSVLPYLDGKIGAGQAAEAAAKPLQEFMLRQTRKQDLALFIHLAKIEPPQEAKDTPFRVLAPAFVISELKTAFTMGFLIYLPFLLVDLVVASVLTSMGIVMMPPVVVSAPFKILLFVLADGWHLVMRALSLSFG